MLDMIRQLVADTLEISTTEINTLHDALLKERSSADGRYAAKNALQHPEGSTTPLNETYLRAQKRLARLRKEAEKELPKALAKVLVLQIAEERRDEALIHRDQQREADADYIATGVKVDTRDWMGRLVRHGVYPNYLKAQTNENVAIVADLLAWKSKDPTYRDPDNPWRAVLGIYAGRRIEMPGRTGKAQRSVPGTPTRDRHINDIGDYLFNELVDPEWGLVPAPKTAIKPNPLMPDAAATIIAPVEESKAEAIEPMHEDEPSPPGKATSDSSSNIMLDGGLVVSDAPIEPQAQPEEAIAPTSIEPDRARTIAEAIYATSPIKMGIYWPDKWVDRDDFEPSRLVPALEARNASNRAWSGSVAFLEAVRAGKGREFIAERRQWGVGVLIRQIIEREETALKQAREAGFDV